MFKKERREEENLISQIRDHRNKFRESLRKELFKEREERHKKGEVFFNGFWVPQNKIEKIQKAFETKGKITFLEIHVLIFFIIFLNIVLWIGFKRFLLP